MKRLIAALALILIIAGQVFSAVDDSYTKSLLHLNTDLTDESGKVWAITGTANIGASVKKFGAGSLYLNNSSCYIETPSNSDFNTDSEPFTIDFWAYAEVGDFSFMVTRGGGGGSFFWIYFNNGEIVYYNSDGVSLSGIPMSTGQWTHIAIVREITPTAKYVAYANGVKISETINSTDPTPNSDPLVIGGWIDSPSQGFVGYIDEFRFSKGIARWTADFTPPTEEYGGGGEPIAPTPSFVSFRGTASIRFSKSGKTGFTAR